MKPRRPQTALLHYAAPPVIGGVEAVLRCHAGLLAEHGYPVQVIAGRGQAWDERIPLAVIPLLDSRHPQILAAKSHLDKGTVPKEFGALVEQIRAALGKALEAVDLLVAHNVCSLHKNLALTAALHGIHQADGRPRIVLWHHDLAWTAAGYRSELHSGWPWNLLSTDWGAEHVVVSEFRRRELADLMGIDPRRITVVPNGVDTRALLKLSPETRKIVDDLNLLQADPILLVPVRITRRKNLELALRACAILREAFPRAALLITGPPGPHNPANRAYLKELQALRDQLRLPDHVHFLTGDQSAPLSDEAIADLFRLADALLLPSREEGFGIPLLEASLVRIPIFCTDIPSLQELGGEQAHYFPVEAEPAAVAQLLATHLNSSPEHARAVRARQAYDWQKIFEWHLEPIVLR